MKPTHEETRTELELLYQDEASTIEWLGSAQAIVDDLEKDLATIRRKIVRQLNKQKKALSL